MARGCLAGIPVVDYIHVDIFAHNDPRRIMEVLHTLNHGDRLNRLMLMQDHPAFRRMS